MPRSRSRSSFLIRFRCTKINSALSLGWRDCPLAERCCSNTPIRKIPRLMLSRSCDFALVYQCKDMACFAVEYGCKVAAWWMCGRSQPQSAFVYLFLTRLPDSAAALMRSSCSYRRSTRSASVERRHSKPVAIRHKTLSDGCFLPTSINEMYGRSSSQRPARSS